MFSEVIEQKVKKLIIAAQNKGLKFVTVESCTGGLVGASITAVSGSSDVYERGLITYSNAVKQLLVKVSEETLTAQGAVSDDCVLEMAKGAQLKETEIVVSVSGIAGPTGDTEDKPVGLVYFGIKSAKRHLSFHKVFDGNRDFVRIQAVEYALDLLMEEVAHA